MSCFGVTSLHLFKCSLDIFWKVFDWVFPSESNISSIFHFIVRDRWISSRKYTIIRKICCLLRFFARKWRQMNENHQECWHYASNLQMNNFRTQVEIIKTQVKIIQIQDPCEISLKSWNRAVEIRMRTSNLFNPLTLVQILRSMVKKPHAENSMRFISNFCWKYSS